MVARSSGPLAGMRIVELDGSAAAAFACMMLADMGCDVVRIRSGGEDAGAIAPALYRGRSEIFLDLTLPEGRDQALALIARADGAIEGLSPGAAEALGLGPERCLELNPMLVYGRVNPWGCKGPLARTPGSDINQLALAGLLHACGPAGIPLPPLNLVAEYAGGALHLVIGMVAAILSAQARGSGQVVESSHVDGAASLMTLQYTLLATGRWTDARAANFVDGGAPFYRCYVCSDGRHVAVGALDAAAFHALCTGLGIRRARLKQYDRRQWPAMEAIIAREFAQRGRDEWADYFAGTGACVTPVLSLAEAPLHPQNQACCTFGELSGAIQPMPTPRFADTPSEAAEPEGTTAAEVLDRWS